MASQLFRLLFYLFSDVLLERQELQAEYDLVTHLRAGIMSQNFNQAGDASEKLHAHRDFFFTLQ